MDCIDQLGEEIGELSARVDAATQRLLACIRRFDEAEGWAKQGAISCAHWLAWRIGLDPATARERVRVARALGALPRIDQAFASGELSYAKVRALTRVATPAIEERLLELARQGTGAQLERICRGLRQVRRNEAIEVAGAPPVEDRSVRQRPLPGGMVRLELTLSPDEAALVMAAVEKARDDLRAQQRQQAPVPAEEAKTAVVPPSDVSAETPRPSASRADGVVFMANQFLTAEIGGRAASGGDRYQVMIHLDQDVLGADGTWAATLDDGTRVSAETLRRVACDAALVPTETDAAAGGVLNVGRRTRAIPPAIRRALWLRDRGCRFPGCLHTRFLHGHHIQHWLHGGATSLANLVLLCSRHHHLVHEGGFSIEVVADGALSFRGARGPLPFNPPRVIDEDRVEEGEQHITADTNHPLWDGDPPDYGWAVSSLLD